MPASRNWKQALIFSAGSINSAVGDRKKMFTETTERILRAAGWYPGRHIDISKHIQLYKEAGFEIFDNLTTFLHEFADLNISYGTQRVDSTGNIEVDNYTFDFNIERALSDADDYGMTAKEFYEIGHQKCAPVGQVRIDWIVIGEDNILYFCDQMSSGKISDTITGAIEDLCGNKNSLRGRSFIIGNTVINP